MAPVIRTYQGRKCINAKIPPPTPLLRKEDSFDRVFGLRRSAAHVFSSSGEASASHSRLETATPKSCSYDPSKPKFFTRKIAIDSQTVESSATPKGPRKKRAGKKPDILNLEKLCKLKSKKRELKRCQKKKNVLLKPLSESTPVKCSFDASSGLGTNEFDALRIQDSTSNLATPTTRTLTSITDSIVAKFGGLNFGGKIEMDPTHGEPSSFHDKSETLDDRISQVLEVRESAEPGGSACSLEFGQTFTIAPSPILASDVSGISNDAADVSFPSFLKNVERHAGGSGDVPYSPSAESTPLANPRFPQLSGDSPAFAGFSPWTPTTLQTRYQYLEKKKTCDMVGCLPRRARSMLDIILDSRDDQTFESEDTVSTVRQPCKKFVTETSVSSLVNANLGVIAEPPTVRLSRGKLNLSSGSVRSSLQSRHYTTCDEMPVASSASSGDSPDSCQSSDDLSRESLNERDEEDEEDMGLKPNIPSQIPLHSLYEQRTLEPLQENVEEHIDEMEEESSSLSSKSSPAETPDSSSNRTPNMRRKASRYSEERSPTGRSSIGRALVTPDLNSVVEESDSDSVSSDQIGELPPIEHLALIPGKKYRRSLSILRNLDDKRIAESSNKGRKYKESVEEVIRLQNSTFYGDTTDVSVSLQSLKLRLSVRRSSLMKQMTPPPRRRSTVRYTIYETPGSYRTSTRDSLSFLLNSPRHFQDVALRTSTFPSLDYIRASLKPDVSVTTDKDDSEPSPMAHHSNISSPGDLSFRDLILAICEQTDYVGFSDILKKECYDGACKLGEGVYGEVFGVKRGNEMTVLKIIPVEGNFCVNDADQKTFAEICPELLISLELSRLRQEKTYKNYYLASGFVEILKISLVQGRYPRELVDLWRKYNEEKGSDNDDPKIFDDEQVYAVIEQANGGTDLENYSFSTAKQVISIFKQIAFTLAVAESAMEFEHRDLHWGNVLVSRTKEMQISFHLKGAEYKIPANGVKGTIIDYTLSRISYHNEHPMNCDLSKDPELFLGSGDYQFDVYRQMKKDVGNEWSRHVPKTNVRWLHYLIDKMQKRVKYQRKTAKVHKDSMVALQQIESWIDNCDSAYSVALQLMTK